MNEIEKAIRGLEYNSRLDGMPERRKLVDELCLKFNNSLDDDEKADILKELLSEQSQLPFLQGQSILRMVGISPLVPAALQILTL